MISYLHRELPPISVPLRDAERLRHLAEAAGDRFPQTADFLARELERASIIIDAHELPGLVTMGSSVLFRDDETGKRRLVTLVYPEDADIDANRISVLTPIGAALIGLSTSQTIEFQLPNGKWRTLTVLKVNPSH